jgi:transposase
MVLDMDLVKSLVRIVMRELQAPSASKLDVPEVQQALQMALSQPDLQRALLAEVIQSAQSDKKLRKALAEEAVQLDILQRLNPNAAGLDIGAAEIWVCVPEGRDPQPVRMFPTFTSDLNSLADWLQACHIETVAMESTGVYWIPVYELLESRGFQVFLVNARHLKNVPGKKTDVLDCQWIQQLHTFGLLRASFRPAQDLCALRAYVRHRDNLMQYRSSHIQHMQKALAQMNVQLTLVLSDITGETGMQIIRAIVAGERDPHRLAQFRDVRCAKSEAEIAKALTGHYREEHVFELKQSLALYDFYTQQIQACDAELERKYTAIKPVVDIVAHPLPATPKSKRRKPKNAPAYDLRTYLYQMTGVDLTAVDGLDSVLVQDILSEIGLDMSPWPTDKHFTSWLRLAPHNDISGGKVLRSRTGKTTNRATRALRLAAQSVSRTDTALGAFFRRMRAKHGAPKAIVATACKIARIIYHMLKDKRPYVAHGADYYDQKYQEQAFNKLKRQAAKLGMKIVPATA